MKGDLLELGSLGGVPERARKIAGTDRSAVRRLDDQASTMPNDWLEVFVQWDPAFTLGILGSLDLHALVTLDDVAADVDSLLVSVLVAQSTNLAAAKSGAKPDEDGGVQIIGEILGSEFKELGLERGSKPVGSFVRSGQRLDRIDLVAELRKGAADGVDLAVDGARCLADCRSIIDDVIFADLVQPGGGIVGGKPLKNWPL